MNPINNLYNFEESTPPLLPQDHDVLPHHTNIERVVRRIFEIHVHWRHNATPIVMGFVCFLGARSLQIARESLLKSDTFINSLEEEVQLFGKAKTSEYPTK